MILHSSSFILHFMKGKLSHRETLALSEPKVMFHRLKHDLKHSRNHLSVNNLQKTSKIAFFSSEGQFLHEDAILEGSKFE